MNRYQPRMAGVGPFERLVGLWVENTAFAKESVNTSSQNKGSARTGEEHLPSSLAVNATSRAPLLCQGAEQPAEPHLSTCVGLSRLTHTVPTIATAFLLRLSYPRRPKLKYRCVPHRDTHVPRLTPRLTTSQWHFVLAAAACWTFPILALEARDSTLVGRIAYAWFVFV